MLILTIRTDKPEAEIGLYDNKTRLAYYTWLAHRELAETLELKLDELLSKAKKSRGDLDGIIVFKGPGSFTGLRIGISCANALAYSLNIPIVGSSNDAWISEGIDMLLNLDNHKLVIPEYGSEPNITAPTK